MDTYLYIMILLTKHLHNITSNILSDFVWTDHNILESDSGGSSLFWPNASYQCYDKNLSMIPLSFHVSKCCFERPRKFCPFVHSTNS